MASLTPLSEIPTVSLLYKLGRLQASSSATSVAPSQALNNKISLIRTDITKLQVDSIVNAANGSLLGGGGVDGAIHRAAGKDLLKECRTLNGCDTGSAKITNAYNLPCKKVIHAVGPVYTSAKKSNSQTTLLQGCYRRSLQLAAENNLSSIAFSALSTGVYGYPSDEAAEAALDEVKRFLESEQGKKLDRVIFCNFEAKGEEAYQSAVPRFFPPTEHDLPKGQGKSGGESLATVLPDVPTKEPSLPGQPEAKRMKVEHHESDGDWENVEAGTYSAENGASGSKDPKGHE
ncbi:MAG: hypothetical protein M4579_003805 [Chaenotheca gracillima]|nr:MAG: hypothetical protein M4579_003805 [Chaenotheca gracillima]